MPAVRQKKKPKRKNKGKPNAGLRHPGANTNTKTEPGGAAVGGLCSDYVAVNDAGVAAVDATAAARRGYGSDHPRRHLLIDFCCGPDSRLGNSANMVDDLCKVVRLTEEQDMTTASGYEYAMRQVREFGGGHITLPMGFHALYGGVAVAAC